MECILYILVYKPVVVQHTGTDLSPEKKYNASKIYQIFKINMVKNSIWMVDLGMSRRNSIHKP